ncbi:MAG: cysteine desulfurase [Myxococcales bacterium]|nr:cysteine desulfurase [Myxococcales bacterium]
MIAAPLDFYARRADFPALSHHAAHSGDRRPLIYLDHAATSQKPQVVLDRLMSAYIERCANVHRGVYAQSEAATRDFEGVRRQIAALIDAPDSQSVVFTKGTTESMNLLAYSLGQCVVQPGDEVLVTQLEHHSNFLPWQELARSRGAKLVVAQVDEHGRLSPHAIAQKLSTKTKLLACTHASNVTGELIDVRSICQLAKQHGTITIIDGAQATAHLPVSVRELGCDFYCFSAHKMLGPFGVGILWGRAALLRTLPAWQTGGGMVLSVRETESDHQSIPHRFEAGTPAVAEVIALGAAVEYLQGIGLSVIAAQEEILRTETRARLRQVPGLRLIGPEGPGVPVISFVLDGVHPHDVATALAAEGIAVRAGLHCAEPLFAAMGVRGSVRVSLSFVNTIEEIETLCSALVRIGALFR